MAKIKICGIYRDEDTSYINMYRPDYFGMIINFERSHRCVSTERAAYLRKLVDKDIPAAGVFVNEAPAVVETLLNDGTIDIAQLHGNEDEVQIRSIQRSTGKPVWKAFRIRNADDVKRAFESPADLILLDNGYGTGQRFDWDLVGAAERPFAIAGGITVENIQEAIERFDPYLLDISSGVETDKVKDAEKIRAAVMLAREAFENS